MADWDPDSYGLVNSLQQEVAKRALGDLVVRGDERVLDVGCGDGRVTAMVADRLTTGSLVGVDPSEAMVEAARRRFPDGRRVEFEVGTAATLAYESEFDLVTSFNALHWETHWREALEHIRLAMRIGGRALLVFVCDGERPSIEDVTMEITQSARFREWFADFEAPFVHVDPDEYAAAASLSGLEVNWSVVTDIDWDFGSRQAFEDWCSAGTVAWTSQLPEAERSEFVSQVITSYAEISGSDSLFKFLQCRMALIAR